MAQEEKDLLLRDLCARLPYGVKIHLDEKHIDEFPYNGTYMDFCIKLGINGSSANLLKNIEKYGVKPYLRPMSSMTDEEHQICNEFKHDIMTQGYGAIELYVTHYTNWLDKKHLDWRRTGNGKTLIEAGLALKAPEGMYR